MKTRFVGVLDDQRTVGHRLAQLLHGGKAIFRELIGRPASDNLDPMAVGRALRLFAQHGQRPAQRGHAVPPDVVGVVGFIEQVHMGVIDARDQSAAACVDELGAGVLQSQNLVVGADRIDAAFRDRKGGRFGLREVAGEDVGIENDQVRTRKNRRRPQLAAGRRMHGP